MNFATKTINLPSFTVELLEQSTVNIDSANIITFNLNYLFTYQL